MCLGPVQTGDVWGGIWPAACAATGRIATEKLHLDKDCFSALEKPPVGKKSSQWLSRPVVLWDSLFKLSINQTQALTYTSLCPWVFIVSLCGPCFPSQTFVGSYSLHPAQMLMEVVGEPFSINRYLYRCIREIVERWYCVWDALQASTAPRVLVLIRQKCGSNWCSSSDQYNGESGLRSLSACCRPGVAIYKQVLDRSLSVCHCSVVSSLGRV